MQLSTGWIQRNIVDPLWDSGVITDYASEYGEPGYSFDNDETPIFLIGDWWCRCGNNPHAGRPKYGLHGDVENVVKPGDLHSVDSHHPRVWAQLESQGVETAFYDEWWVDPETSKAYRTTADSYRWQSSIQWNDEMGDYMTPDTPFDDWLEWALNDHERCLMASWRSELEAAGFTQWEPHDPHDYHNGWHEGMDDRPEAIVADINRWSDEQEDIVFLLDQTSQFYVGFSAWIRPRDTDTEEEVA